MNRRNGIGKILFWLGDVNIFIAIAAGSATLATYAFHSYPPDFNLVGFIFFATLFTYNLQRRAGNLESTETNHRAKTIFLFTGLIGMIPFMLRLTFIELLGLAIAGGVSIGYAVPCIRFRGRWYTIREIPYMKLWVIVLAWILSTCVVPLVDIVNIHSIDDQFSTVLFIIQQGAFIVALTIPFDIRDLKVDEHHYRTLPMIVGVNRSVKIARNAMIIAFVAAFFNYLIGFFAFPEMMVQLGISLIGVFLVRYGRIGRKELYYSIFLDGMIILQGVAVYLVAGL